MTNQNDKDRDRRSQRAGNSQRDREQGSTEQGAKNNNRPWGRATALVEFPGQQRNETKARFIPIGAVWQTEGGNFKFTIDATPPQWNDPHFRRVVVISKNEDK